MLGINTADCNINRLPIEMLLPDHCSSEQLPDPFSDGSSANAAIYLR